MERQKEMARLQAARGEIAAELVLKNAKIINVFTREIVESDIAVQDGIIIGVGAYQGHTEVDLQGQYVSPGFIDAHLHLESTMTTPPQLIKHCVAHGTTTYIADPHEAANVKGWDGIRFILEQTEQVPANVYVMLPSCVPATPTEMAGCVFDAAEMQKYKDVPRILGLGEVMDYVSVVHGAPEMADKLAQFRGRPCDGHAPNLSDGELSAYVQAGISTDHECTTFAEALRKRRLGMHIHIREGSAAKNLDDIVRGMLENQAETDGFSFCTDDLHIEDIRRTGHIDHCIRRAIALGLEPIRAYQMATIQAARCYGLTHLGAIAPGYQADFVILRDLEQVEVTAVWHKGQSVMAWQVPQDGVTVNAELRQTIHLAPLQKDAFVYPVESGKNDSVIGVLGGQIVTEHLEMPLPQENGVFVAREGLNKLAIIERHHATGAMGLAILKGFSLRGGAIGSSVSHDSHNLLVVGDQDDAMHLAVQELERVGGGYTVVADGAVQATLPLPIMGLMTDAPYGETEQKLQKMLQLAHEMGVPEGIDPFITLSFLALPVIPALRITPRGLFDVARFALIE